MKKKLLIALCVCTTISGIGYFLYDNIIPEKKIISSALLAPYSQSRLESRAELVVSGKITKINNSKWSNPDKKLGKQLRNDIVTDVSILVNETYKGTSSKEITVRTKKGKIGKTTHQNSSDADFIVGEDVLLFLMKDDDMTSATPEDYYVLTGLHQGKFVKNSNGDYISPKGISYTSSKIKEQLSNSNTADVKKTDFNETMAKNKGELFESNDSTKTNKSSKTFIQKDDTNEKIEIK